MPPTLVAVSYSIYGVYLVDGGGSNPDLCIANAQAEGAITLINGST